MLVILQWPHSRVQRDCPGACRSRQRWSGWQVSVCRRWDADAAAAVTTPSYWTNHESAPFNIVTQTKKSVQLTALRIRFKQAVFSSYVCTPRATINRYLLPPGLTAANLQRVSCCVPGLGETDGQTDERTPCRYIDPAPHTMRGQCQ